MNLIQIIAWVGVLLWPSLLCYVYVSDSPTARAIKRNMLAVYRLRPSQPKQFDRYKKIKNKNNKTTVTAVEWCYHRELGSMPVQIDWKSFEFVVERQLEGDPWKLLDISRTLNDYQYYKIQSNPDRSSHLYDSY